MPKFFRLFFPAAPSIAEVIQQEISHAVHDLRKSHAEQEYAEAMVGMLKKRLQRLQAEAEACK